MISFPIFIFYYLIFVISIAKSAPSGEAVEEPAEISHSSADNEFYEFVKGLPPLGQKYDPEAEQSESKLKLVVYLGILHSIKQKWNCKMLSKNFDSNEHEKCEEYGRFLANIYNYFLSVYAKDRHCTPPIAQPPKPEFMKEVFGHEEPAEFRFVLAYLSFLSKFYFINPLVDDDQDDGDDQQDGDQNADDQNDDQNADDQDDQEEENSNKTNLDNKKNNDFANFMKSKTELSLTNEQALSADWQNRTKRIGLRFDTALKAMAKKATNLAKEKKWLEEEPILYYYLDDEGYKQFLNHLYNLISS